MSRHINNDIERKLYAESMGRCMNPDCKKELFEINQENAIAVITKQNPIVKFFKMIQNKFNGYEKFSKTVLQKHASKINKMKTEIISNYINKTKQDILRFSGEVKELVGNS